MMKNTIFTVLVTFCIVQLSFGQMNKSNEKIRALKVAYITEKLELTSSEAEKFWPIYNQFDKSSHELRFQMRQGMRDLMRRDESLEKISDQEALELINLKLKSDQKLLDLEKQFVKDLTDLLSPQKIIKLQMAEMEFGKKLMRRYRGGRGDMKGRN